MLDQDRWSMGRGDKRFIESYQEGQIRLSLSLCLFIYPLSTTSNIQKLTPMYPV